METDSDDLELADARRHHQRARVRHAKAWIEADLTPAPSGSIAATEATEQGEG